ncbi:Protein kinase domain-containing protein [Fusarium keratoplasticum]|nr:Protein kinase domain-containing protein [Fusarium keratoplasticum]
MEISRITAGCKEFNPIGEDDCPLCGPPPWQEEWKPEKKAAADVSEKPGNESNLNVHFTSHLRYLAFQSLRWWDVDINGEEDEPALSQDAAGFNSKGSAGTTTHEDSTAANIDLDGEELKVLQDARTHAEEEELLERGKYIPTSATETVKSSNPNPTRVETMEPTDSMDDLDLRDKISEATQGNIEGQEFIPADAIVWLASRESVEAELMDWFSDERVAGLANYVLTKPAIKVFLILVMCKNIRAMDKIQGSGFGDQHLPLDEQIITKDGKRQRQLQSLSQLPDSGPVLEPLRSWRVADRREFLEKQWAFMAPVFTPMKFVYKLHNRCPLPFIPFTDKEWAQGVTLGGLSGSVKEIKVHEAHQKVLPQKDGKPIHVALKTIWPPMGHYFHQEEDTMRVIQKIDHPHLIKPIASYQYDNQKNGCFLFPWAEHGNLKEFWKTEKVRPLKNPEMMGWMLKQMRGLCHALSILHDAHRRHGDIKPENILLFEEGDYKGTLRIADVGLGKFYAETTEHRILLEERTKAMEGTTRYLSPEFIHGNQIPRVFDVWALGCVFIEFIIWTLHGYDGLFDFRKACSAHFWEEVNGTFIIHAEVRAWISNLEQILGGSETALESLLGLVELHMLVPDYERRSSSTEVHEKLVEICRDAENDPRYLINPEVESRARTNPPRLREPSKNLALPERPRTRLAPLSKKQGSFHIHVEGPDDWDDSSRLMISQTFRAQQASIVLFTAYGRLLTVSRNKDDKYISYTGIPNVNNEFAQNLFSNPDWSHPYPAQSPSKFCEKCSSLDIWQPGFEFGGLVGDIRARSKGCDLCLLFTQAVSKLKWEDSMRLLSRRIDSVIRIMPDGPTILSLYSDPGTWPSTPKVSSGSLTGTVTEQILASPDAQIGYPLLPKPGSLSQFAFIREWLRVCRETHDHEHLGDGSLNPTELPTRVIDLGVPDKPRLRLVTGGNMESHEYFALSHCWGKSMMFRALKENIETLTKAIDFRRLPRTFQQAIRTARGLNVRYLWIDSLCIIQDDQEDWEREAARMQQVFSNATCVIAASSAGSSAEGFLETPREARPFVTLCSPSGATSYVCKFIDNFAQDMEEAPLNQRGWVLQERALARRSIHFTSTQVYLECGEGVQCESLMKLANGKVAILGDSDFPNSVLAYYKGGRLVLSQNLFKMYSRLKFTNSSDRAVAISGLEKRLMSAFKTNGGYGVFQVFFERSVLWQRPESGSLASIAYPADRNVPSWSWMSYDGSITYVDAPFEKVDWTKDYESPFEAKPGTQYWGIYEDNPSPIIKSKSARRFSRSADPERVLERIRFDLETSKHLQPEALRCIVIGKSRSSEPGDDILHYVLVITALSSGKPEAYVRVGVGVLVKSLISWGSEEYVEVH